MTGLVYDTGALLAAERRAPLMWSLHDAAIARGFVPLIPLVVLAQAWRGGPQASLSRLLRGCLIRPESEALGRAAGSACARAGTSDVVDAIVVVTALAEDAAILTSDPDDLRHIADALEMAVPINPI